jgi:hypothetical protein
MRYVLLALIAFAPLGAIAGKLDFGTLGNDTIDVSVVSLIATPERFHGKAVRVTGAFRVEFEGNNLCLHTEDLKNYNGKNCLWLSLDYATLKSTPKELSRFNGQNVLVEGTFNKDDLGHLGCCSGSIDKIWRVTSMRPENWK